MHYEPVVLIKTLFILSIFLIGFIFVSNSSFSFATTNPSDVQQQDVQPQSQQQQGNMTSDEVIVLLSELTPAEKASIVQEINSAVQDFLDNPTTDRVTFEICYLMIGDMCQAVLIVTMEIDDSGDGVVMQANYNTSRPNKPSLVQQGEGNGNSTTVTEENADLVQQSGGVKLEDFPMKNTDQVSVGINDDGIKGDKAQSSKSPIENTNDGEKSVGIKEDGIK
jgi:hypothetical protein